jgi:dihydrofolate reductase
MQGDTYLLGRTTYEMLWPGWSQDTTSNLGSILHNMKKYVISTTLSTAPWEGSSIISGNVVEEITKLKQQPGKDINSPQKFVLDDFEIASFHEN